MIRQDFVIEPYEWMVTVFYCVSARWSDEIECALVAAGCAGDDLEDAYESIVRSKGNTGLTYSGFKRRRSVVVISDTSSPEQFMNSWDHEKGHLVKHIAKAFVLDPFGEKIQYLAGYIGQMMFPYAKPFLCEHCREHLCD